VAGNETTTNLISNMLNILPAGSTLAASEDRSLVEPVIMRRCASIARSRSSAQDLEPFDGGHPDPWVARRYRCTLAHRDPGGVHDP
jgi:hypothetical protein